MSLIKQVKRRLKPLYAGGRRAVAHALFRYSPAELEAALREIGLTAGGAVFVHSGFQRTSGFQGSPGDVIDCLRAVTGPQGHVLMMSIPYRGSSQRYAESDPLFDVRRTPSAVGVISEVFRRRPEVVRSLNPLHPVLASGPLATWLTLDHEKTPYSCGRGSPFERLLQLDATFLFFDAPYHSLTFMHYVEDQHRDRLPFALYGSHPLTLRIRDYQGVDRQVRQFFFSEEARARRDFGSVERALSAAGAIRRAKIGNSRLLAVKSRAIVSRASELMADGPALYR